jgi:hypothetical protein
LDRGWSALSPEIDSLARARPRAAAVAVRAVQ